VGLDRGNASHVEAGLTALGADSEKAFRFRCGISRRGLSHLKVSAAFARERSRRLPFRSCDSGSSAPFFCASAPQPFWASRTVPPCSLSARRPFGFWVGPNRRLAGHSMPSSMGFAGSGSSFCDEAAISPQPTALMCGRRHRALRQAGPRPCLNPTVQFFWRLKYSIVEPASERNALNHR
jgi:hypothetical protein